MYQRLITKTKKKILTFNYFFLNLFSFLNNEYIASLFYLPVLDVKYWPLSP